MLLLIALYFALSIAALLIATYTDFKERIIPNSLTYSIIAIGLGLQFYSALVAQNFWIAAVAIAVTAATFAGSYGLWRVGVWAGGDVKLMTGIAALNPVNYAVLRDLLGLKFSLLSSIAFPLFPLTLFIFSVFAMLPYGAIISIAGLQKDAEARKELFQEAKKTAINLLEFCAALVGVVAVVGFANIQGMAALAAIIAALAVWGFLKGIVRAAAAVALFAFAAFLSLQSAAANFLQVFLTLLAVYLLIKLYMVSKSRFLRKKVKITELKEGDIPAETLIERNGKIVHHEGISIARIIKNLKDNNVQDLLEMLSPKGRIIVNSRRAAGVEKEQIEELNKLVREGKLDNEIKVSLSAPFVPAVLIAYIALQLCGDLLWNLLF